MLLSDIQCSTFGLYLLRQRQLKAIR
jgi:hypothetical protein